jgi:hypothetical protein
MDSDFKGKIGIIRRRRDLHIDAEARNHPRDPRAFESPDRTTDKEKTLWN